MCALQNVLVRTQFAFERIAVEKGLRCLPVKHQLQLPAEIVDILKAGIRTPRAEWRNLVRAVAGKDNASVAEILHAPALECIDRHPFQIEVDIRASISLQPWDDVFRLFFLLLVDIPAKLKVDPPDAVRLFVKERGLILVERRVKPEPALGREIRLHDNVGDQEIVFKNAPDKIKIKHAACRRPGAIAGDQPIGFQIIGAIRRFNRNERMIVIAVKVFHPVAARISTGLPAACIARMRSTR